MANIRNLLGKQFKSTVSGLGTTVEPIHDGKVLIYMSLCAACQACDVANPQCICNWCVPCGVTRMTFEIWGGGGAGAGACCCMMGIPGTTGAYAIKTVSYPDVQGGSTYCMCVAPPTSQTGATSRGVRGCKTWITGPGLTNFCAEGGYGGCTCCGILSTASNCTIPRIDFCSAGACLGYGPPAYGGDCNIPGRAGFLTFHCSAPCAVKAMLPYPPRIIDHSGGWVTSHYCADGTCGETNHCFINHPFSAGPANNNSQPMTGIPSFGNASAIACNQSCYCGNSGPGGMIRITYCSCWNGVDSNCSLYMCN